MGKYLIADIPVSADLENEFRAVGLEVFSSSEMTRVICAWNGWNNFVPRKTLLVFPGNGASIVLGQIPKEWLNQWPSVVRAYAKRYWEPGQSPWSIAGRVFYGGMILGLRDVVVVDDVVSSGETCRKLHKVNDPWIPGAQWHVVTWVKQRSAHLRGFKSSFAVVEVGTSESKDKINSLSTLVKNEEIARSYSQRNFTGSDMEVVMSLIRKARG